MYKATDIANWFLLAVDRESGDSITHLKLQKLLYYAQAWTLTLLKKPLFDEEIQAWMHGPVIPEVFTKYAEYSYNEIPAPKPEECIEIDKEYEEILEQVMETYGIFQAKYLEELTHSEAPWKTARAGLSKEAKCTNIITKESMEEFYTKQREGV